MQRTIKPDAWVQIVNGRPEYRGKPWKVLANDERTRAVIECYEAGVDSDDKISRFLDVRGHEGGFSRSAVGGHIHRNRKQLPDWLLMQRKKALRTSAGRPKKQIVPVAGKAPTDSAKKEHKSGRILSTTFLLPSFDRKGHDVQEYVEPSIEDEQFAEAKNPQAIPETGYCKWPIGDPRHEQFRFCWKMSMISRPYCEFHTRRSLSSRQ